MSENRKLTVKELPLDDRPREKLLLRGPQSLLDAELVAILLRTGKKGKSVLEIARELISSDKLLSQLLRFGFRIIGHGSPLVRQDDQTTSPIMTT